MVMRKPSPVLLVILLLGTAFTGCLSAGDAGENLEPKGGNETENEEDWESMPGNRSGDMSAYRETNQTEEGSGGMAHDHDYWQGRSRVNLFETTAEMPPGPAPGGSTVEFKPPPPALVFEGTGHVEITISNPQRHACNPTFTYGGEYICTSNPGHWANAGGDGNYAPEPRDLPAMDVEFLHGASAPDEWISAGTIEWDTPFQIEVEDPMWTDMPHASASLWAFKFVSQEPIDSTLVFDVSMDVVRSEEQEIPKWPGHPDFYPDRNARQIFEGSGATSDAGEAGQTETIRPERLISYGTETLHVWANVTNVQGAEPTHWYLRFHNASYTNWNITSPFDDTYSSDNTENYWILRVSPEGMDSPYQSSSRWEFEFRGAHSTPALSCYAGCFPYRVEYDLSIIATNEELPEDMYSETRKAS